MRAIVIGSNGQDGSFLCDHLLARGYTVLGLARQDKPRYCAPHPRLIHRPTDLRDSATVTAALQEFRPDLLFHVAAVHGAAGFSYELVWRDALAVNVASVHCALEYIRQNNPAAFLVYASSSKVFGDPLPSHINERSAIHPTCLYSLTKITARDVIDLYRRNYGVGATVLHLFNHESERRGSGFFIPRIVSALAKAKSVPDFRLTVRTLDFFCDWGSASEYMDIAIDIAERRTSGDFILASGKTWLGRDLVRNLFAAHGLDYCHHIAETLQPPGPISCFHASTATLHQAIGRTPRRDILDVCCAILKTIEHLDKSA